LACIATPAARTHSLAPPQQLSKPGLWHVSPTLQLIRTPWHPLVSYLHVSHRRSSNCFETVVLWTCRF
jgi:hypothetical protein